jgi:MFS family permease
MDHSKARSSMSRTEKAGVDGIEDASTSRDFSTNAAGGRTITGFDADIETAPEGYLWSINLWGSLTAIGMSFGSAVGQFALAAPILDIINEDIGPNPNITWISYVAVLGIAVSLPITARYTDIFGRRIFVITEQAIMAVGAIVGACAPNVPTLIGATAIMSSFSGGAYSYSFLANEILPMKYRFMSTGFCIIFAVPFSGFAPAISLNVAATGAGGAYGGWRWVYWLMAILNVVSTILLSLFYFPPSFRMKHSRESRLQIIKEIDYLGILIFAAGIIVFILGISWGGVAYPWKSAAVIVSIVGGAAAFVCFVLWERFGRVKQPFVPLELFRDRDWVIGTLMLSFGASIYYAFALVWPSAVAALYSDPDKPQIRAILTCCAAVPCKLILAYCIRGFN